MERQTCTVEEAGRRLGISRALAYKAAARGELPVLRIGKRYLIVASRLDQLLAGPDKGSGEGGDSGAATSDSAHAI